MGGKKSTLGLTDRDFPGECMRKRDPCAPEQPQCPRGKSTGYVALPRGGPRYGVNQKFGKRYMSCSRDTLQPGNGSMIGLSLHVMPKLTEVKCIFHRDGYTYKENNNKIEIRAPNNNGDLATYELHVSDKKYMP